MIKGEDQPISPVTQSGSSIPAPNRFLTPTKRSTSPVTGSVTLTTLSAIRTQIPKSSEVDSADRPDTTKTPLSPQRNNPLTPTSFVDDDELDSLDDILILDDLTGSPVQPTSSPCNSTLNPDAPVFEPMSPVDAWGTLKQESKIAPGGMNKFDECSFLKFAANTFASFFTQSLQFCFSCFAVAFLFERFTH